MVLGFAAVAGYCGAAIFAHPLLGVLGFLVIVASTAEMFVPLKYKLDERGASVRCGISVTALEWSAVKRVVELSDGVCLSPLPKSSRLDAFRGVHLRFAGNEDEVRDTIRQLWRADA